MLEVATKPVHCTVKRKISYNIVMKKIFPLFLLTLFAAACAGNPPAWWNPNNRYGSADGQTVQQAPQKKTIVIKEEDIEPLPDVTYEEVTLTPMPDEEGENSSGAAAGQNQALNPDENLPVPSVLD